MGQHVGAGGVGLLDELGGREGGSREEGWRCRGEEVAAGAVLDHAHRGRRGCHEGAGAAEGLSECADEKIGRDSNLLGEAASVGAEDAEGVRLIDHQPGGVTVGQVAQLGQGRLVAVHREEGLGHDQGVLIPGPVVAQQLGQVLRVGMSVDEGARAGEATAIDQARVVEGV